MTLYAAIMCGGAGTRLWPSSRPSKPKQFVPLIGQTSLFQDTLQRVVPLTEDGGEIIVVGGVAHRRDIIRQLSDISVQAQVLLEPVARDSAAAMAAAAAWISRTDPEGVILFVASDHHIPDHAAFRATVKAGAEEARRGRIVTLGIKPNSPSSAYGYISPDNAAPIGVATAVRAFVEKPDELTAEHYIDAGYLWNSGNFIVRADVLLAELAARAPAVLAPVLNALPPSGSSGAVVFGSNFAEAEKISIDYAVMEKTSVASVIAADFVWSDLGAWDAVASTGRGSRGLHILDDAENCLVRTSDDIVVSAVGVKDVAIIVERDAVLVCNLARAQDVKKVVARLQDIAPAFLDFPRPTHDLRTSAARFGRWLRLRALPVWSTMGLRSGAFTERLTLDGADPELPRRARVQARQIQVFSEAGRLNWGGDWRSVINAALEYLKNIQLRPDGLMRAVVAVDGSSLDESAAIYDQAFLMFALAAARKAGAAGSDAETHAIKVRETLLVNRIERNGLIETGAHPYQSNCHMHLLEAFLAWEEIGSDPAWKDAADWIGEICQYRFVDPDGGFLREFFDADWRPAAGPDGDLVEPGHQFEWAWLMARLGRARNAPHLTDVARRLYACGVRGLDEDAGVVIDGLNAEGTVRYATARLWPQTEWLKAALILSEFEEDGPDRARFLEDANSALAALSRYLTEDGLWFDRMLPGGKFLNEAAPASSLYHIMAAYSQLSDTLGRLDIDNIDLSLNSQAKPAITKAL